MTTDNTQSALDEMLSYLKLAYMRENYESLAKKAAQKELLPPLMPTV